MTTESTNARSTRFSAGMHSIISLLLAGSILLMVNYVGFKYYVHKDLSTSQFYSLSPKTIDVLRNLDGPVTITTLLSPKYEEEIENLLKEYQRVGGKNIIVEKIDPAYDVARATELQKRLHFEATDFLIIFEYKDRSRFVKQDDLFDVNPMTQEVGGFKGEQQFTSTLVSIVEGKASKVYFTEGHGEHPLSDTDSQQGYGALTQTLKSENIETASLNLASRGDVPPDADAVVIAGPSIAFSPIEAQSLEKYVDEDHGKLLILLDPYVTLGLDDLLKKYGMKFDDDLVLYRSGNVVTSGGTIATVPLALIYQGGFSPHPITTKLAQANLQLQIVGARSMTLLPDDKGQPNAKVQFLLQTDADAWGWVNKTTTVTSNDMLAYQDRTFDKTSDLPGPLTIAAEYDGGMFTDPNTKATVPDTRIIAVGASKFLTNEVADTVGANFFSNCLDWLVKKDAILDIAPKIPDQYGVNLSPMQSRTVAWTCLFFIPGTALVLGIMTWFSRRK